MKEKMTREEAIDWLCRLKSNLVVYMPKEWHENIISALSVAIQALEQQPCEDIPTITIPVEDYIKLTEQEPTTKNDLGVDTNKLLADCEKMSFDIEIFNKPLKVVALDAVKNIAKDLINSENPNKSEILTGSTTKNDLSSGLEKNSKKLEKDYGELDCVSRKAVLEITAETGALETQNRVKALPPVTPIRPNGHWIDISYFDNGYGVNKTCSICNHTISGQGYDLSEYNYCPNCGAKMESEET